MLFVRQLNFVLRADNKPIPVISAKDGTLLTNEYINDIQRPYNRVFAARSDRDPNRVILVRYEDVAQSVTVNTDTFSCSDAIGIEMDAILLTTELNKTFAQMLRTIGLEQEVPAMLPNRWLTI